MMTENALVGAGCFWGVEHILKKIEGILSTEVGYAGGAVIDPTYPLVCSGKTGHAEVVLIKFDPLIISYEKVLKNDSYNATAHYYIWLCRKYLNQTELAGRQIKYLSAETIEKENLKNIAFTGAGLETSFKSSDNALRGNTFYQNFHAQNRFGYNILMDQMVSFYNQTMYTVNPSIQPGFPPPPPQPQLRGTSINQKEYYNKLTANLTNQWQVKAAYHYTYNSIGTSIYNNQTGFVGLKYTGNYFDLQVPYFLIYPILVCNNLTHN